jgi:drug/metabolite transporter (DMT)-like permease
LGNALVLVSYALVRGGREVIPTTRTYWRRGFVGGVLQVISYGTALWAMTVAPIAIVATLRETSILFGAVFAVVVLKEPLRAVRIAAALLVVCGLVLLRLQ